MRTRLRLLALLLVFTNASPSLSTYSFSALHKQDARFFAAEALPAKLVAAFSSKVVAEDRTAYIRVRFDAPRWGQLASVRASRPYEWKQTTNWLAQLGWKAMENLREGLGGSFDPDVQPAPTVLWTIGDPPARVPPGHTLTIRAPGYQDGVVRFAKVTSNGHSQEQQRGHAPMRPGADGISHAILRDSDVTVFRFSWISPGLRRDEQEFSVQFERADPQTIARTERDVINPLLLDAPAKVLGRYVQARYDRRTFDELEGTLIALAQAIVENPELEQKAVMGLRELRSADLEILLHLQVRFMSEAPGVWNLLHAAHFSWSRYEHQHPQQNHHGVFEHHLPPQNLLDAVLSGGGWLPHGAHLTYRKSAPGRVSVGLPPTNGAAYGGVALYFDAERLKDAQVAVSAVGATTFLPLKALSNHSKNDVVALMVERWEGRAQISSGLHLDRVGARLRLQQSLRRLAERPDWVEAAAAEKLVVAHALGFASWEALVRGLDLDAQDRKSAAAFSLFPVIAAFPDWSALLSLALDMPRPALLAAAAVAATLALVAGQSSRQIRQFLQAA
jgi:hypothetical protein